MEPLYRLHLVRTDAVAGFSQRLLPEAVKGLAYYDFVEYDIVMFGIGLLAALLAAAGSGGVSAAPADDAPPRAVVVLTMPQPAAQVAGAVFRTPDGKLWLLHDFDPAAGLVQYVVCGRSEAVTLTIRVLADRDGSAVSMTYDMVALDEVGAAHLAALAQHARPLSEHLHDAVSAYLARP